MENDLGPKPALVLLCKRPALGHSKQRLAGQIGLEPTLHIAEKLLQCALEDLLQWPYQQVMAPDSQEHLTWAQTCVPNAITIAQAPGNLGQRIQAVDRQLRELGHSRLLFIGSDCPALDQDHYYKANQLLNVHDTVLIAARDGGVVLMASNYPWPELSELPWSTEALGEALKELCLNAGHSVIVADMLGDIDHEEDLAILYRHLAQDRRPARQALLASLDSLGLNNHARR